MTLWGENIDINSKYRFISYLLKMLIAYIWAWIWWILVWYVVFYLRYQYRDTVNELRSHVKEANKQIQYLQWELDEYMLQNQILKEKTTELLEKNDDLNEVVSELSTYYVHMKKASEKTQELNEYLANPDEAMEDKIKKTNKKLDDEKKFF